MDRHTLFYIQGGLLLFLSVVLHRAFLERRQRRGDSSGAWAAVAFGCAGIGMLLQSYRGVIPAFFSIILGNGIFMMFGACFDRAIAQATGARRDHFYLLLLLAAATVANFWYYTYDQPNVLLRIVEAVGVMTVQYAAIVSLLLKCRDVTIRPALRAMAGFYTVHVGMSLAVIAVTLRRWHADAVFSWTGVITITGVALCFVWIEGLRMSHELEARATTDPLTELLNRRGLEQLAAREQSRAHRHGYPCSALSLDVNSFKQVNDTWGHSAGDQALCAVAGALRATLRATDIPARLGGDEFFVLLPDCDEVAVQHAARRIRAAVDQLEILTFYGEPFRVSVSIGAASAHGMKVSLADLMHASDILLYQDKQRKPSAPVDRLLHSSVPRETGFMAIHAS